MTEALGRTQDAGFAAFDHPGACFDGEFDVTRIDGDPAWWRLGWTYRWLQAEEDFYDDTAGLRLSAARVAKLEGKPRSDEVFSRGV